MAQPRGPALTVDCVLTDRRGRVLLIRRRKPPFAGHYALPGGFVDPGETVEDACRRELGEETGAVPGRLTLVGVYSEPGRDPRGPTVTVAYKAVARSSRIAAGDDAVAAEWIDDWRKVVLAFDHARILADALGRRRR